MANAKGVEADLAAINAAGDLPPAEAEPLLRKALKHRSNLIASRAARHAARLNLTALTEPMVEAFHRFMADDGKSDPQCWAKHDLAKALAAFEYQPPDIFLAGLRHIQLEPTWGGSSDSAGNLRGTCALALVQCRELSSPTLLRLLTPLFADKDLTVRVNAARAIEQIGSDSAALLLRLRAELSSDSAELLAACIGGVLRLDGDPALPWVSAFLTHADDTAAEAAFVLAEQRSPEAVNILKQAYAGTYDRDFRATLLTAIATTRISEATTWLLDRATANAQDAQAAADALYNSTPTEEISNRLRTLGFHPKR